MFCFAIFRANETQLLLLYSLACKSSWIIFVYKRFIFIGVFLFDTFFHLLSLPGRKKSTCLCAFRAFVRCYFFVYFLPFHFLRLSPIGDGDSTGGSGISATAYIHLPYGFRNNAQTYLSLSIVHGMLSISGIKRNVVFVDTKTACQCPILRHSVMDDR